MSSPSSALAAFLKSKSVVLAKLVPCVANTVIGCVLAPVGGLHGLVLVLERARAGEEIGPTDVLGVAFDDLVNRVLFWAPPFALFVALTIASVVAGMIPGIGTILMIVLMLVMLAASLVLSMISPYALISQARDKTPWLTAWKAAAAKVRADIAGNGLYMLITGILGQLGSVALGIGMLITFPMGLIAQLEGYEAAGGLGSS